MPETNDAASVTDRIRDLILSRDLLPGQKIVQLEVATRIGISRSPLREALRMLEAEGLVQYETNRGYVVARLEAEELVQIYRLRELIETDLLRTLPIASKPQIEGLIELNQAMKDALSDRNAAALLKTNREFHFAIFAISPLKVFQRELKRLWQMSEGYRATYLSLPSARERIVLEHDAIIQALATSDTDTLVTVSAAHRSASAELVTNLISR